MVYCGMGDLNYWKWEDQETLHTGNSNQYLIYWSISGWSSHNCNKKF